MAAPRARLHEEARRRRTRAVDAYEHVLDLVPGHPEATSFLADHFTSREMWEHLVALYEGQLVDRRAARQGGGVRRGPADRDGALAHARAGPTRPSRGSSGCASSSRRTRACCRSSASGAARAARARGSRRSSPRRSARCPTGPERTAVVAEIAKLAEEGANAQKAIEQWRALLRQDPKNKDARDALKRLYRQTASWNALTDLLRQELEKLAAGRRARAAWRCCARSPAIYRDHVKSDSALVTVLTQIVQLDADDLAERPRARAGLRGAAALARSADDAGPPGRARGRARRSRPSSGARSRAAGSSSSRTCRTRSRPTRSCTPSTRATRGDRPPEGALRQAARLQAALRSARRSEARGDAAGAGAPRAVDGDGEARRRAPRHGRRRPSRSTSACSTRSPSSAGALDALEKQAERDKDFATVAEVLERRASVAPTTRRGSTCCRSSGASTPTGSTTTPRRRAPGSACSRIQPGHAKALRVLRDSHLAIGDYDGLTELYAAERRLGGAGRGPLGRGRQGDRRRR